MTASDAGAVLDASGIVYFGNDWSAENRTSSHHIARRLARRQPLLYVDSPGQRAPSGSPRDVKKLVRKLAHAVRLPQPCGPNTWVCTVPQLPYRRVPGVNALNGLLARWLMRRAIRHVGFSSTVLWFALPHPGFLAGELGEKFVVYYCIDDYAAHPGVDADWIQAADDALTRKADRVFVAPPALLEPKRRLNAAVSFAPHGVDAELFGRAAEPETVVPPEAQALPHPIIGFFGSVADWIDVPLLAAVARLRPRYTVLMIGHVTTDVAELTSLPNVKFVGPQRYETLPQWAKAFDVAIIPYRRSRQVMNANPLKLREYLATGKPVVSVSTPEVDRFEGLVRIANDADAFAHAIDDSLQETGRAAADRRMQAVRPYTWDARVLETVTMVANDMRLKLGGRGEQ